MGDVSGDRVDLSGSVLRELEEETGVAPHEVATDAGWTIVFEGPRVACIRTARVAATADELAQRITRFLASEERPELAGVHMVRGPADLRPGPMPDYVIGFLDRRFSQLAG